MKFEFCIPTTGKTVPAGDDWFHEVKYDGYRLRLERDGERVRLITKGGYDWTKRFPWIVQAALKNHTKQFVVDGEAVKDKAELLIAFTMPATREHPFMYHCHILEHEDAGMMGQYTCA